MTVSSLLVVLALISAVVAAISVPTGRVNMIGVALAFFFASLLVGVRF